MKQKKMIMKYLLWLYVVIVVILRIELVKHLPIIALSDADYDDNMMVNMAYSLLDGKWLGSYNYLILQKGMIFPLMLAFFYKLGISYITGVTILYIIGCFIFVYSLKDLFKNSKYLYIIFTFLIFNPIMFDSQVIQRVYRNSITQAQVMIIMGCLIAIYSRLKSNRLNILPWSILAGLTILSFFNTREDAIWLMPFIIVVTIINLIIVLKLIKNKIINIIIIMLPLMFLFVGNNIISLINYNNYGVYLRTEPIGSYFKEAKSSIYSVTCKEDIEYVSVPREKWNRLYAVSPTLLDMKPYIESSLDTWSKYDRNKYDNEVEDGWFTWSFRSAVNSYGGYKNAQFANQLYKKIHEEIEVAIDTGILERKPTMPIKSMSPWRGGYTKKIIKEIWNVVLFTIDYDNVRAATGVSTQNRTGGILSFENITKNNAIYPVQVNGWFIYHKEKDVQLKIIDKDLNIIEDINIEKSDDLYEYFKKQGEIYENAKSARFSFTSKTLASDGLYFLAAYDTDGNLIKNIPLDGSVTYDSNDIYTFNFDNVTNKVNKVNYLKSAYKCIEKLNIIISLYQVTGTLLILIGITVYIYISFLLFKQIKVKNYSNLSIWLILTALIASYFVLLFGVVYAHISAFDAINTLYLSPAYILITAFWSIAISYVCDNHLLKYRKILKESK